MTLLRFPVFLIFFGLLPLYTSAQSIDPGLYISPGYTIFQKGRSSYDSGTFKGSGQMSFGAGIRLSKSYRHFMFHTGLEFLREGYRIRLHDFGYSELKNGYIRHIYRYNSFSIPFLAGVPVGLKGKRVLEIMGGASFGYKSLYSASLVYEYPSQQMAFLDTLHLNFPFDPVFGGHFHSRLHFGFIIGKEKSRWSGGLMGDYPMTYSGPQTMTGFIRYNAIDRSYEAFLQPRVLNLRLFLIFRR